jgi:hypothetical protein
MLCLKYFSLSYLTLPTLPSLSSELLCILHP